MCVCVDINFLTIQTHQRHQRDTKSRGPTNNIGLKIHPTVWAGLFIWAHHRPNVNAVSAPPYQTERAMAKELELGLQGSQEWLFASNQRKPLAEGLSDIPYLFVGSSLRMPGARHIGIGLSKHRCLQNISISLQSSLAFFSFSF